jgi:hypothetical protein
VSSVVTAPEGIPSRPSQTTPLSPPGRSGQTGGDVVLGALGALALGAVTFAAGGGNILGRNTWVEGGLVILGALVAAFTVLLSARARARGAGALICFAALVALTYASIAWSVQPANSWIEANRTLSYFAAFATALLLARLAPGRWRALLGAVALAATAACAYSLLVKVFPATLDAHDPYGRLRAPFDYWNAVGLMAAMGLPACLWAGTRREPSRVLRALAVPATAVLVAALGLSFSRGAVLVAAIAVGIWLALAPLRLRSALVLILGAAGGAAISVWGSAHRGISADGVPDAVRISAGHSFGVVIVVVLVICTLMGFGAALALERVALPGAARRRLGMVLVGVVALVPVGGVVALVSSSRGFSGEVSHLWKTLTNPNGGANNQPGRLADLSNSRTHYWRVALRIGEHHPLAGVGALGFATAQTRYGGASAPDFQVTHAHGYLFETFADFGAIGLAVSLALLLAWILASARTFELAWTGRGREAPRAPPSAAQELERTGLVALLAIVITFGVHSLIDWTWFIPGDAVVALVCAGWLTGRGPLSRPTGRRTSARMRGRSPGAVALIVSIALLTVAAVWGIAAPLRSSDSYYAATTAAIRGDLGTAFKDAHSAASQDPVSIDPLLLLASLYWRVGEHAAARQELAAAVVRQPANPESWEHLGCYDLGQHRATAASELHRALVLDPRQTLIRTNPGAFCGYLNS